MTNINAKDVVACLLKDDDVKALALVKENVNVLREVDPKSVCALCVKLG